MKAKQVKYKSGKAGIKIEVGLNRELVRILKNMPAKYHSKGKYWTCELNKRNALILKENKVKLSPSLEDYLFGNINKVPTPPIKIEGLTGTLRKYQEQGVSFINQVNHRGIIADDMGLGKEQPLYCKILTPFGWKRMGSIQVGDFVIGSDGKPTRVTGVYPQGEKDAYEVLFTDGSRTECGLDHLWNVRDVNRRYKRKPFVTKTTRELLERGLQYPNGGNKWDVPLPKAVKFSKKKYKIHPYLLGVLLGDGYLAGTSIAFSNPDIDNDITERIKTYFIPQGCQFKKDNREQHCSQHRIIKKEGKESPILTEIRRLKLDVKSKDKFIPRVYKIGSVRQRLELLKGLMDTDGTVTSKGVAIFWTTSPKLAKDVVEIVRSLGGVSYINQYGSDYQVPMFLDYCPFYTQRKRKAWKQTTKQIGNSHGRRGKFIKEINYVGKVKQQCISVSNEDGLYITDDYIVTHNTIQALAYCQYHHTERPVLIIVPGCVKYKWQREIVKWIQNPGEIQILSGKTPNEKITGDIVIINYDILHDWRHVLYKIKFKIVVIDEVQYIKENTAKRTKVVKHIARKAKHLIGLSGTPIENRPKEIYNIANLCNPKLFPNMFEFGLRYCAGYNNGMKWDFSGASNTRELNKILLENIMIRRLKTEVLKELPPIQYSIIPLILSNKSEYNRAASDFINYVKETKGIKSANAAERAETLSRLTTLKQLAAIGKIEQTIEWVDDFLQSGNKLVLACWHRQVLDTLYKHYSKIAVRIDGSTKNKDEVAQQFQTQDKYKLAIVNMKAGGVGLDLFAAADVAIMEYPWSPTLIGQMIARVHRMGQKSKKVTAHFLVGLGTIDDHMVSIIDKKQKIIDRVMDGKADEDIILIQKIIDKLINQ